MKLFITGISGSLGSLLASHFKADGNDKLRIPRVKVDKYLWKYTEDLTDDDLKDYDVIFYASEPITDRPLGNSSPTAVMLYSFLPLKRILDYAVKYDKWVIYASSFNALYGHSHITVDSLPDPSNFYAWAKASEELLIRTYRRMYNTRKLIITRVSSAYGAGMRFDEMPAQIILRAMYSKPITVRSPFAKRVWTFNLNVVNFYKRLLDKIEKEPETVRPIYHLHGDKDFQQPLTNLDIAWWILRILDKDKDYPVIFTSDYEPGEFFDGHPVDFTFEADKEWDPLYTFEEGIKMTAEWFSNYCSKHEEECQNAI